MNLSSTNFSNWFLKPLILLASTTSCGKEVQSLITFFIKKHILLLKASAQSFNVFFSSCKTQEVTLPYPSPRQEIPRLFRYLLSSFSSRLKEFSHFSSLFPPLSYSCLTTAPCAPNGTHLWLPFSPSKKSTACHDSRSFISVHSSKEDLPAVPHLEKRIPDYTLSLPYT